MTEHELAQWLDYHGHLFEGFKVWWKNRHPDAVEAWADALRSINLEAAKQASQDVLTGDVDATGWTSHLKAIRARAHDLEQAPATTPRNWADGNEVFSCRACFDSGNVTIFHPIAVADAIEGKLIKPRVCGVPCSCQAGARHLAGGWNGNTRQQPTTTVFSQGQHCEFLDPFTKRMRKAVMWRATGDDDGEKIKAIAEVAEGYHQTKRHTVFDEWNESGTEDFPK